MSSPRPPNNNDVQYPALPGPSSTSTGTPNDNAVMNSNAQGLLNDASVGDPTNNADGTSNNITGGSSNTTANQESSQISATTRQTRSSGRVALESLGPIEDLDAIQLLEQQQYEINRIIAGSPDEALGQFHLENKAAMTQVYRQLSALIHPDKQPAEWKEKATEAQSILNNARDKFDISIITEEIERPKRSHQTYWDPTPFQGAVRRLQIDPVNQRAFNFLKHVNSEIQIHNTQKRYTPDRGKFPLIYFQDKYQNTQALRVAYKNKTDPEEKKELAAIFKSLCVTTQEFCVEHGFPRTWAWQYENIDEEPSWLSEAEGEGLQFPPTTGIGNGSTYGTVTAGDGASTESGNVPGTAGGTVNGASTESGNVPVTAGGTVAGASTEPGNVPVTAGGTVNGASTEPGSEPGNGSGSGSVGDVNMRDLTNDLHKVTLDGEPIISKRNHFRTLEFLVEERSGLHVWKPAQLCGDLNPDDIPSIEELTKDFVAEHKYRYKGIRWIAMSVDDAVTVEVGRYPHISVMVEWLGDLDDTLMWRSGLHRIANKKKIDDDLHQHFSYRKWAECEGLDFLIMSQTQNGLLNGEMKAIQKIKNDRLKAMKASQTVPQWGAVQSNAAQSGFAQQVVSQPTVPQPDVAQSQFAQQGVAQSAVGQPALPSGVFQSNAAQPSFAQSVVSQPAVPQPAVTQSQFAQQGVAQSAVGQLALPQSTQVDMIPSSTVEAMIASAVQRALQQHQQQPTLAVVS